MENKTSTKPIPKDLTNTFILHQNQQLRQQLTEVRELLDCNKRALRVNPQHSHQQRLLTALYQQNQCLKELIRKRQTYLQTTFSNAIIHDQIMKNSEDHEKSVIDELNIKLVDLRRQLRDRDQKIESIQKTHQIIDSENVLQVKLLETTPPNSQILKQYDMVNRLREQLEQKDAELAKERLQKEEVFRHNILLNKQLDDLKISFGNQPDTALTSNDNPKALGGAYNQRLAYIFQMHKTIFSPNDSTSRVPIGSLDFIEENLPVPKAPTAPAKKPSCVPTLELTKAKQIQEIVVKNMFEEEKTKTAITNKEFAALKEELSNLKKNINSEVLKNAELSRKTDNLQRLNSELEYRNRLLERSKGIAAVSPSPSQKEKQNLHNESRIEDAINIGRAVYLNANIQKIISSPKQNCAFIRKQRSISQK